MTKPAMPPEPALSPKTIFNLTWTYGSKYQIPNKARECYLDLYNKALANLHLPSFVCPPGLSSFLLPPFLCTETKQALYIEQYI